jgi:potassium-dependent mechanosensitive channel
LIHRPRHFSIRATAALLATLLIGAASSLAAAQQLPPDDTADSAPAEGPSPGPETQPAEQPAVPANGELTQEALRARIEVYGPSENWDQTTRTIITRLNEAIALLDREAELAAQAAEVRREGEAAPATVERLRKELEADPEPAQPDVAPDAALPQLEQGLTQARADFESLQRAARELDSETERRRQRRSEIPDQIASLRQQLEAVNDALDDARVAERAREADGTLERLTAEQRAIRAQIAALEAETASYAAREDLLPLRQQRAQRRVNRAKALVERWQALVDAARQAQARRAAEEARQLAIQAAQAHPVLEQEAQELTELAASATRDGSLNDQVQQTRQAADADSAALQRLRKQFNAVDQRLETLGLNRATGLLLRRQFDELTDPAELRREREETRRTLERTQFDLIERREQLAALGDVDAAVDALMERVRESDVPLDNPDATRTVAEELIRQRSTQLSQLVSTLEAYDKELTRRLATLEERAGALVEFRTYIEERILWVRSVSGRFPPAQRWADTARAVASPSAWREIVTATGRAAASQWPLAALLTLLTAAVVALGHASRRRLARLADLVKSYKTDSFNHTLAALAFTFLAALPASAIFWWVGWALSMPAQQTDLGLALGEAMRAAGWFLLPLLFLQRTLSARGLATPHFRWNATKVRRVRSELRWFLPLVTPVAVVVAAAEYLNDEAVAGTIGRAGFTVGSVLLALVAWRTLSAIFNSEARNKPNADEDPAASGWVTLVKGLARLLVPLVPLTLVVLCWLGFYYTSFRLASRLEATFVLVILVVVTNALLMRWLFLARRRVAVEEAKRRREQAMADARGEKAADHTDKPTESTIAPIDENKLDLPAISAQTSSLFRTLIGLGVVVGLFVVWADVLPALRMLERVEIFPELRVAEEAERAPFKYLEQAATGGPGLLANETAATPVSASTPAASDSTSNGATLNAIPGMSAMPGGGGTATTGDASAMTGGVAEDAVTVADILFAVALTIATIVLFRSLPALVDIVVLSRLPLDSGARYALSTVVRYVIAIIGVSLIFAALGLAWNKIQWLAAALTFGLAFGLQEIFANFISGLIILAERPIRLGDTVTVSDISGKVTRIRMRATTITDWDRKELIIPNKDFITNNVINWTLSDPILRVIVPVGVSYDSDVRSVEQVLLQVASRHEAVLQDPRPRALFLGFGDSTLNFELRVFIPNIEEFLRVKHDLHMQITEACRNADIEIAYPQRDLHVRSIGPLEHAMRDGRAAHEQDPITSG